MLSKNLRISPMRKQTTEGPKSVRACARTSRIGLKEHAFRKSLSHEGPTARWRER